MRIPLLGGSYEGISTNTSSQECINFYYEPPAPGESHLGALLPVHGTTLFHTLPNGGAVRAVLYNPIDSLLYIVADNDFYEVTSGASETARGNVPTSGTTLVSMALNPANGEILIVDGTGGSQFDSNTDTFSSVTDADFPDTATVVVFLNGYMLVNVPGTPGRFQWSNLNDADAWASANFDTALSMTSPIKSIIEDKGIIYLLGDINGELWYNSGSAAVFEKFERINYGIVSDDTLRKFDNSVVWLARTENGELVMVRVGQGFQPEIISTPELSRKWHEYSTVEFAYAYTYAVDGHEFYVLTFPSDGKVFAYDASTKMWAQRSGAFSAGAVTRDGISCSAFCGAWGGHILGSSSANGKLFALSETVYTRDSVAMERRATGPILTSQNEAKLRMSEVQIDIESGTADVSDTGTEGQLTFSYSKNKGHTYSDGVQLELGTEPEVRLMKRKLGWAHSWNFRIYTNTPHKIVVKGAYGRIYNEPFLGTYSKREN